jgi:cbb3-type cytochrome oxidase maturation protein
MPVVLILILVSLSLALVFLGSFIWAVKSGQYEDTCTPAMRVLSDEEPGNAKPANTSAISRAHSPVATSRQSADISQDSLQRRSAESPLRSHPAS